MSTTIKVDVRKIQGQAKRLSVLSHRVANRKINKKVVLSKGNLANSLNNTIITLNDIGQRLAELYQKTGVAVDQIAIKFSETDERVAKAYRVQSINKLSR